MVADELEQLRGRPPRQLDRDSTTSSDSEEGRAVGNANTGGRGEDDRATPTPSQDGEKRGGDGGRPPRLHSRINGAHRDDGPGDPGQWVGGRPSAGGAAAIAAEAPPPAPALTAFQLRDLLGPFWSKDFGRYVPVEVRCMGKFAEDRGLDPRVVAIIAEVGLEKTMRLLEKGVIY